MSRHGYTDGGECDSVEAVLSYGRYQGALTRAIRGTRGQSFLRELIAALDAMPVKELLRGVAVQSDGSCCALGAVAIARGVDIVPDFYRQDAAAKLAQEEGDPNDADLLDECLAETLEEYGTDWYEDVAKILAIPETLARETIYTNDEGWAATPEERWREMRQWAAARLRPDNDPAPVGGAE